MTRRVQLVSIASAMLAAASPVWAWHAAGHHRATEAAVATAGEMPEFFRQGSATIAHCSLDPDAFTRPIAPVELHRAESPEHYFDMELLRDQPPPADRYAFISVCAANKLDPARVGLLPYAVTEWTERLAVALAEHRKWPDNPHVKTKCLVYAGILAHYAEDLCMPLHTTIHYDGRAGQDGSSPRTGIHLKVDALLGKCPGGPEETARGPTVRAFGELLPAVVEELGRSHAMVGGVYELEGRLPEPDAPIQPDSAVQEFTLERLRTAAAFTASLYATAWRLSEKIELPDWHKRETPAAASQPATSRPGPAPAALPESPNPSPPGEAATRATSRPASPGLP